MQKHSLLRGYPGHDALLPFYDFSKKKSRHLCRNQSHEREVFLVEGLILQEVKTMACVGQDIAARSKFLAPTPLWLRCEDLRA
jgi:hypothetical protein